MKIGVELVPFVSGLIILSLSVAFWMEFTALDSSALNIETKNRAQEIAADLEGNIVSKIHLFETVFMNQWLDTNDPADLNSTERWNRIVPAFFNFYSGYLAINWIDPEGTIRIVYPYEENKAALNRSIVRTADGNFNSAFNESRTEYTTHVSHIIPLYQGGVGFVAYIPIIFNSSLTGFINVVLRTTPLFESYLSSHLINSSYHMWVYEDDVEIYSFGQKFDREHPFLKKVHMSVYDNTWDIYLAPNDQLVTNVSYVAHLPVAGVGFATFIIGLVFSQLLYNKRALEERQMAEKERLNLLMQRMDKLQALGTMAGGMAHNFNNLLMGIQGNTSLAILIAEEHGEEMKDLLEQLHAIEEIIGRSKDLTQQILMFSRQQTTERSPVPLNEVIRRSISLLKRSSIQIQTNLVEPSPIIIANYGMLQQVFVNMLNNAIESMSDRSKRSGDLIVMSSKLLNGSVVVEISDSGVGMDEETLKNAIEPFFTTKKDGTGLGLPMSIQYVNSLGGTFDISSEPGVGTTVTMVFPIGVDQSTSPSSDKTDLVPVVRGKKILIVEDDPGVRTSLTLLLERHGASVTSCGSAEDATGLLDDQTPDVAVVDVSLPGKSGVDFTLHLQKNYPSVKAFLITGFTELAVPRDMPVLYKPFNEAELLSLISELLSEGG